MRTKADRGRTMLSSADAMGEARPFLVAMLEREERRTGSKMAAYEAVAALTGVSSSWVRKIIGRQAGLALQHHVFLNIAAAYSRICERIEAEAERERRLASLLREKADAALSGDLGVVAGAARKKEG